MSDPAPAPSAGATAPPPGASPAPGAGAGAPAGGPPAGAGAGGGAGGPPPGAGAGGPPGGPPGGGPPGPPPIQLSPLELNAKKIVEMNRRVNIGSYLIGLGLDMILLGILLNQFAYWRSWVTEEKIWRKATVYWVCLVGVASSAFGIAHLFNLFVFGYERFVQFLPINWFNWYPIFAMLMTVPIQVYFTRRAFRLNEQTFVIPLLVAILMVGEIVGCLNQKILETSAENFQYDSLNKTKPFVLLHFACNLAIQLVIFSSIVIGLFRKPNGPFEGGSNFFVKFLKMTNESQFFPTIIALLMLLWYSARPTSHFLVFWMIVYPKVSAVCFMAQVNSLIALRHKTTSEQSTNRAQDDTFLRNGQRVPADTVQVSTDIYVSETKLDGHDGQKFSVNRGPYPHPDADPAGRPGFNRGAGAGAGGSAENVSEDDIGKDSQHSSAWSPTTWDDKRRMDLQVGKMV